MWVVKDTTGKIHHPTFKFIKGKHAGAGKMFCFLVKSDACHCIEDNSEDDAMSDNDSDSDSISIV